MRLKKRFLELIRHLRDLLPYPTQRSSDLLARPRDRGVEHLVVLHHVVDQPELVGVVGQDAVAEEVHLERLALADRSKEHMSELQSRHYNVCRLLLGRLHARIRKTRYMHKM